MSDPVTPYWLTKLATAGAPVLDLAARRQETTTASGHSACPAPKTRSARPAGRHR